MLKQPERAATPASQALHPPELRVAPNTQKFFIDI